MQFKRNFGVLRHFCGQHRIDEGHTVVDHFRGLQLFSEIGNILIQLVIVTNLNITVNVEQNVFQIVTLYGNLSVGLVQSSVVLHLILLHFFQVCKLHPLTLHTKLVVE